MITNEQLEAVVASKYALLASHKIFRENKEIVLCGFRNEIQSLSKFALLEVCTIGSEFFKLPGVRAEDYKERVLELKGRSVLIAGIRFRGLDVTKPFLSVVPGFIPKEEDLELIGNLIKKEFKVFKPQSFQMTLPNNFFLKKERIEIDRYMVVGQIEAILQRVHPKPDSKIELIVPEEIDFYETYLKEYALFHEQVPALKSEVRSESYEVLYESMKANLLFKIMVDKKFAGLIAGSERNYHGLKGVMISEEILFKSFRSKGLGFHIHNEFAKKLKGSFSVLWGTISHINQPSLRTALKNGREIIETDYLFKF